MEHASDARDREVGLEVLLGVPREGPYPVPRIHAEVPQRRGKLVDPIGDLGEGGTATAVTLESDDLAVGEHGAAVTEDHPEAEGKLLHR